MGGFEQVRMTTTVRKAAMKITVKFEYLGMPRRPRGPPTASMLLKTVLMISPKPKVTMAR